MQPSRCTRHRLDRARWLRPLARAQAQSHASEVRFLSASSPDGQERSTSIGKCALLPLIGEIALAVWLMRGAGIRSAEAG